MSSMAKIFVVVNLVLGVAAFGSAATLLGAKEEYKAELAELTGKFDTYKSDSDQQIQNLRNENNAQTSKASQAVARANTAEAGAETVKQQLAETKSANDKLLSANEKYANELAALRSVHEQYKNWLEKYSQTSAQATQDKLNFQRKWEEEVSNRVRLESEVAKQNEEISSLAGANGDLQKKLKNATFWLNKYRERFGDITSGPKGAAGRVLTVRGDLVTLSVGSADGVRVGDTYQIARGASYVGQVTVTKVFKDQAVGRFDTEFKGSGAPPQPNDVAEPRAW